MIPSGIKIVFVGLGDDGIITNEYSFLALRDGLPECTVTFAWLKLGASSTWLLFTDRHSWVWLSVDELASAILARPTLPHDSLSRGGVTAVEQTLHVLSYWNIWNLNCTPRSVCFFSQFSYHGVRRNDTKLMPNAPKGAKAEMSPEVRFRTDGT